MWRVQSPWIRESVVVLKTSISPKSSVQTCDWWLPPCSWWTSGTGELLQILRCLRQGTHWKQMQRISLQNSLIWPHTESLSRGAEIPWAFTLYLNNKKKEFCAIKKYAICRIEGGIPWRLCFIVLLFYGPYIVSTCSLLQSNLFFTEHRYCHELLSFLSKFPFS